MTKRAITWLVGQSQVERLLLAATVVAALRMMLIHAVFIGFDLEAWPWFKGVEVASGLAFAVLEGKALAYVSRLWVGLKPQRWVDWLYWSLLAVGQLVLLLSIIAVTAYAAAAVRLESGIDDLLGTGPAVVWSMFVTALNPLMVMLIGIARAVDKSERDILITTRQDKIATKGVLSVDELAGMYARRLYELTPDQFIRAFEDAQGVRLTAEEAERHLLAATLESTRRGAQPQPANGVKPVKNGKKEPAQQ